MFRSSRKEAQGGGSGDGEAICGGEKGERRRGEGPKGGHRTLVSVRGNTGCNRR